MERLRRVKSKPAAAAVIIISVAAFFILWLYISWLRGDKDLIYPETFVGNINIGGLTLDEATVKLAERAAEIENNGLDFQYGSRIINTQTKKEEELLGPENSAPLFSINAAETAAKALNTNKNWGFLKYLLVRLAPSKANSIAAAYDLDEERLKLWLKESFPDLNIPSLNAGFAVDNLGKVKISSERIGKSINYGDAIDSAKQLLSQLGGGAINIKTKTEYPETKVDDLKKLEKEAQKMLSGDGLSLKFQDQVWQINNRALVAWLKPNENQTGFLLDEEKIKNYLENLAKEIDKEAVKPRFDIVNSKVTSWQGGASGLRLDLASSSKTISLEFLNGQKEINLVVEKIEAEDISGGSLKIQEIIGTGHSNFSGSPANRRQNIKVGAGALDGLLIAPGEEFSLVKILGDVSAESGYLPELVIKGDKTVPEYGGGLCQIGTTVFRSAIASGLPITYRRNHSYRVSYYEPAGTDAAIYIPEPDVRFINDTGNYILIQSRMEKNDLYFDFWGVSDGRVATASKPVIYNIVKPAPTKIIESDSLAPGEKKCTEKAHNGADAYFDYLVTYPETATASPKTITKRFNSHYVPWQEVCLVGKSLASSTEKISTSTPISNSSSTPANASSTKTSN